MLIPLSGIESRAAVRHNKLSHTCSRDLTFDSCMVALQWMLALELL